MFIPIYNCEIINDKTAFDIGKILLENRDGKVYDGDELFVEYNDKFDLWRVHVIKEGEKDGTFIYTDGVDIFFKCLEGLPY